MSLVSLFECAYLLTNGIEGDVVACACVWFVERVHGSGAEKEEGRKKESLYVPRELDYLRNREWIWENGG